MNQFTPPQPEELNNLFSAYRVDGFIAQGGMGAVYHGTQVSLDRPVAIKILPDVFGEDPSYRQSFETEAKAMARLNHPNLVGIYDFGELDGMLYIIMEYVQGRSLHESAHGQVVEEEEAARLILDICRGLEHAHEAGLIHRDIKPANILIDDQVRPKIVDFGLARPLEGDEGGGVVFGTPGYTAPEVLNHPENVDQRSDIYSVGVMLYELLTGGMPVDPYMSPSEAAEADERFDNIVARAIQPDPEHRYSSVSEMAEDLEELLRSLTNPEPVPSPPTSRLLTTANTPAAMGARPLAGATVGALRTPAPTYLASSKKKSPVVPLLLVAGLAVVGVVAYNSMSKQDEPAPTPVATETAEQEAARIRAEKEADMEKQREARRLKKQQEEELRLAKAAEREAEMRAFKAELQAGRGRVAEPEEVSRPVVVEDAEIQTFDHKAFIKGLRQDVVIHNSSTVEEYNEEIAKNIDRYNREIKRAVRKLNNGERDGVEMKAEAFYGAMQQNQYIPEKVSGEHFVITRSHFEYFRDQRDIDQRYEQQFSTMRSEYVRACEKKLKELDAQAQKEGIEALKAEVESIREDKTRIRLIARGLPLPDEQAGS
ncbi:Serine/threonine protein kinase [Rubritalea squalenifaciens DSM 18772]|uniref:Serine/threonine protein kinase n=1 Tax=Rubritalea squalenifaciens DSM 18772 TaxID=1123071 RepID=A0A1M6D5S6_9BACT|nr:serine/threonine-protein kinase [Rubritalea squalenifaciens]SHI68481.1 Serine/threonine protein kinase [Rubritalea squalenifaciens DSM 18772]